MRAVIIAFFFVLVCAAADEPKNYRGAQFIGLDKFDAFERSNTNEHVALLSPKIESAIRWNELIVSWNFRTAPANGLKIEAKAIFPDHESDWFTIAHWALEPSERNPRQSVRGQRNSDGRVDTDTLKLTRYAQAVQIRLTLDQAAAPSALKFLGLSFADNAAAPEPWPSNKSAWGKILTVKERSQANYPEGISSWCSPTSMSMLLSFWSTNLHRADLDYDVPDVARGVNDPNWPGTGNWPFNTAFAGAHEGIRAYVTRFSDVSELEDWIAAGIPVAISVSYGYLKGRPERANGHLVVCIGFDENGNVIVNDPGRRLVRQTYLRENLIKAWAESENTAYIVHPEKCKLPRDKFGHWFSMGDTSTPPSENP
jgi:hypothetical protein